MSVSHVEGTYVVTAVDASGPAQQAGVRVGDQLTSIDGHAVDVLGIERLRYYLDHCEVGGRVRLSVQRGANETEIVVTAARPQRDR